MMVEGADDLCELLSYDGTHTKIKVCVNIVSDKMPKGWFRIAKEDSSITGGAHYQVDLVAANSFGAFIWLCPVTLFVLGQYPDYMWIKPLNLSESKMKELGLKD